MASVREYMISLPFAFQNASIITGREEGLYGWVTVNYLMGNFIHVRHCHCSVGLLYVKLSMYVGRCFTVYQMLTVHDVGRKTCGTPTFTLKGQRLWGPWTWVGRPHRLPLQSRKISWGLTTWTLNSTVTPITSTHTVTSAMEKTRLRRGFWTKYFRYAAFLSFSYECVYSRNQAQKWRSSLAGSDRGGSLWWVISEQAPCTVFMFQCVGQYLALRSFYTSRLNIH